MPVAPSPSDQVQPVGGDFFEKVPSADIYVVMRILHDWDDAEAHRILATCRRDAPPTARMPVVETLVPDPWRAVAGTPVRPGHARAAGRS